MLSSGVVDYYSNWMIAPGLAVMIVGPLAFWIGSFVLYGFGELIEKTVDTNEVINNLDEQLYNIAKSIRAIERVACEEDRD